MGELAVSSWSLHRALGPIYSGLAVDEDERAVERPYGDGTMSLLELPAEAARRGIGALEFCHFHFPRLDAGYLTALRARLAEAGVTAQTLLVDAGDISAEDPAARQRDMALIRGWIEIAETLGARQVRVIAGYAEPSAEAVERSGAALAELAAYAAARRVRIITENWLRLSMDPESLLAIVARAGSAVGLCVDFGNYRGASKYDDLLRILPGAVSIHAKAHFAAPGEMDGTDFVRCLDLARAAGFDGSYVLIFDGPGDEWQSIEQIAGVVRPYLTAVQ